MRVQRTLAIFVTLAFLLGSVGFVDAKGGSSFSGGSRGSVSSSASSSRPSSSGFSSSMSSGSSSKPSSPSTSSSSSTPSGSGFTSSNGSSAPSSGQKSGSSWFGGGVDKGVSSTPQAKPSTGYSGYSNGGSSNTTVNRTVNRTVVVEKRYYAPNNWQPTYYYGGYHPSNDFFDLWWKLELLKTMQDNRERDQVLREMRSDPNYYKWKAEADKVAAENAELKAQLAKADTDLKNVKEDENPPVQDIQPKKKSHFWLGLFTILVLIALVYGIMRLRNRQ